MKMTTVHERDEEESDDAMLIYFSKIKTGWKSESNVYIYFRIFQPLESYEQ